MSLFRFFFLSVLGTCSQNFMPTRSVEPWGKHQFPEGGLLKFTYKGRFLTITKVYKTILYWNFKQRKHALVLSLPEKKYFWETLKSRFWVVFQSFVFGQILAVLGSFGKLVIADCMPKLWLKSLKPHNFWTVHPHKYAKSQLSHELIAFKTPCLNQQKAVLAPFSL
jgi:hypothetical protein